MFYTAKTFSVHRRVHNNFTKRILNLILNRKKFLRQENEALGKQNCEGFGVCPWLFWMRRQDGISTEAVGRAAHAGTSVVRSQLAAACVFCRKGKRVDGTSASAKATKKNAP